MLEHYEEISYYIQRLTGDKNLSKDLTQETYVKALEIRKEPNVHLQKAYLYKIAKNLVIDKARKESKLIQTAYEEERHTIPVNERPDEIINNEMCQQKIKECISQLPVRNKKAFILFYYKGYTRKEIALMMGITISAVEKNITRATQKIKEKMMKEFL